MKLKQLGETKLKVSALSFTSTLFTKNVESSMDIAQIESFINHVLESGVNFFNTTEEDEGRNEILLGKILHDKWNKVIIATNFFAACHQKNHDLSSTAVNIKLACEASLKRLGVDVIDLYYMQGRDFNIPLDESLGVMADLVAEGKIRYVGLSDVDQATLTAASQVYPITAYQAGYSLCHREVETDILPFCEKSQISFIASSPFSNGLLANRDQWMRQLKDDKRLTQFYLMADSWSITPAQLALAWLLAKDQKMIVLPCTVSIDHFDENVKATTVALSSQQIAALDDLFVGSHTHNLWNES